MLETVAEKKIPPPLPPKTRRGCLKNGGVEGNCGGGATILQSNGHVVKIRIDPMMVDGGGGGNGAGDRAERDDGPRREHAVGRRSSTVKINITCVDPFMFRRHYTDVDDDDDEDDDEDRRSSSGHRSPLDSGTGSDLDTGSRRDESDDGTCSCDSLTSSTADPETAVMAVESAPKQAVAAACADAVDEPVASDPVAVKPQAPVVQACTAAGIMATATVATVVEELPKRPSSQSVLVQQRCYNDKSVAAVAATDRIIDMDNTDQYYSFHMNENVFDEVDAAAVAAAAAPSDDTFAGCKTVATSDTIRSAKGTIRGVKNRVRAGIATFLQPKTNKTWQEKEAGKVVLYTTTMGIVRDTYQRCLQVRQILRTHLVKYVERDVFMSREVQKEIRERLGGDTISVPQLFVEGNLIGDAEAVERLNESGELRSILKPFKSPDACTTCQVCGGYRLLPCPMCNGSKKSVHRNHFTTEMIALKCMNCDEVGLVQCYAC
ncbi:glutaredoxin domain-containing cysteine-rich protein CG12206-like [Myzus persicae]|uniref:glutaredoxin domain-containing cysteine-rich protein CG12206-like n=1 Tax=Myzus persicae TaxID=13164 RepID=UPI000B930AB9|nr:glutaredoxin domain-containing cysteine-rich protein CG12206-like [Myzus persicae]